MVRGSDYTVRVCFSRVEAIVNGVGGYVIFSLGIMTNSLKTLLTVTNLFRLYIYISIYLRPPYIPVLDFLAVPYYGAKFIHHFI